MYIKIFDIQSYYHHIIMGELNTIIIFFSKTYQHYSLYCQLLGVATPPSYYSYLS